MTLRRTAVGSLTCNQGDVRGLSATAPRPLEAGLAELACQMATQDHLGLAPGARVLVTRPVAEALLELEDVLADRAIVTIEGPPGTGKTLLEHLLMARATQLGAKAVRVQASRRPSGKQLSGAIFSALRPGEAVPRTRSRTEDRLKVLLAAPTQALVIYDEAQNLGVRGIEDIRYYWDETRGQFPLVLSGVAVGRLLDGHPQLADRVSYRYRTHLLSGPESLAFAAALHPLLADVAERDPGLLTEIDHCGVRGTPRRWSTFTRRAQRLIAATGCGSLTDEIAYQALTRCADGPYLHEWSRPR